MPPSPLAPMPTITSSHQYKDLAYNRSLDTFFYCLKSRYIIRILSCFSPALQPPSTPRERSMYIWLNQLTKREPLLSSSPEQGYFRVLPALGTTWKQLIMGLKILQTSKQNWSPWNSSKVANHPTPAWVPISRIILVWLFYCKLCDRVWRVSDYAYMVKVLQQATKWFSEELSSWKNSSAKWSTLNVASGTSYL